MYDIPELEKKWKRYKRNKIKKPILITLSTLTLGAILFLGATQYKRFFPQNSTSNTTSQQAPVVKKEPQKPLQRKEAVSPLKEEEKAIIIKKTPIPKAANKSDDIGIDLSNATIVEPDVPDDEIRVIGFDKNEKKRVEKEYKMLLNPQKKKPKIDPIVQEYQERFTQSKDPQDALYLAKYFYKKRKYQKAEIWAANANNIDGELEDSWLIFAKAKARQGHRVEAIKILQEYYDSTASPKAKELLDKLRRNKPF